MAILDGNLNVTGNISAANYPPKMEDFGGLNGITKIWEITEENAGQCVFPIEHPFKTRFLAVRVFDANTGQEVHSAIFFPEIGMIHVVFAEPQPVGSVFRIIVVEIDSAEEESA